MAAVLVFFAASRYPSAASSRAEPATSVRAAFGPAVDAIEAVAVYTVDRAGRIGYANRGARRALGIEERDVEGRRVAPRRACSKV